MLVLSSLKDTYVVFASSGEGFGVRVPDVVVVLGLLGVAGVSAINAVGGDADIVGCDGAGAGNQGVARLLIGNSGWADLGGPFTSLDIGSLPLLVDWNRG